VQILYITSVLRDTEDGMTEKGIELGSAEIALTSEMGTASARRMKGAYLLNTAGAHDPEPVHRYRSPETGRSGEPQSGPEARVYFTKIVSPTSEKEIKVFLHRDPDDPVCRDASAFFTLIIVASIRLNDPSTTRLVNATATFDLPKDSFFVNFFPRERGVIGRVIESGGSGMVLTPGLDLIRSDSNESSDGPRRNRFDIRIGPEESVPGFFTKRTGHYLGIPVSGLLEYQGMVGSGKSISYEIYPPMLPEETEVYGKKTLAVFAFIVRSSKKSSLQTKISIEGKVKGDLWGVVPLHGSGVM